jgi:hypothetical protein
MRIRLTLVWGLADNPAIEFAQHICSLDPRRVATRMPKIAGPALCPLRVIALRSMNMSLILSIA